ncbi:hypothetical protein EVAR_20855_1 [Eumeta japonica]|uniref:Uncharacterized protein n=1 Tax=Eumeta variegata TaxID=151549 RepID=A0A4C1UEH5_EUMVA|nr:hypothetical protein EVAR_20855_1 [Eumeta japonica]
MVMVFSASANHDGDSWSPPEPGRRCPLRWSSESFRMCRQQNCETLDGTRGSAGGGDGRYYRARDPPRQGHVRADRCVEISTIVRHFRNLGSRLRAFNIEIIEAQPKLAQRFVSNFYAKKVLCTVSFAEVTERPRGLKRRRRRPPDELRLL